MRLPRYYLIAYAATHRVRRPWFWLVVLSIITVAWLGVGHFW